MSRSKTRRPAAIYLAPYSASVVRGPRDDGRWYWRIRTAEKVHATGWYGTDEIRVIVGGMVSDPGQPHIRVSGCVTVRDLLELYVGALEARVPAPAPRAVDTWKATARALLAQLDHVRVDRLTLPALDAYVAQRGRAGCRKTGEEGRRISSSSVRREVDFLRRAWEWARARAFVPNRGLEVPRVVVRPEQDRYTPTPGEVAATLEHLPPWAALACRVLYASGIRIGELAPLRRADIRDGGAGLAWIAVDGKTGPREVAVVGAVARELLDLPDGPLFPYTPWSLATLLPRALHAACDAAGVPRWTPHALRRSMVDRVYQSGVDAGVAAVLAGHSAEVALRHYRKVKADEVAEAARRAKLGDLPRGKVTALDRR